MSSCCGIVAGQEERSFTDLKETGSESIHSFNIKKKKHKKNCFWDGENATIQTTKFAQDIFKMFRKKGL